MSNGVELEIELKSGHTVGGQSLTIRGAGATRGADTPYKRRLPLSK